MSQTKLKGRKVTEGIAEGEALVSKALFGFTHGVHPETGEIADKRHEWFGLNMKGKVLVFPFGKSSNSGSLWILEVMRLKNGPAAIINVECEPIIGMGCQLAKIMYGTPIPLVDRLDQNPLEVIQTGDYVRVDADKGEVEILKRAGSRS